MRLILLGYLLKWKNQLPVGGVPVYSQMSRSKSQQFHQLNIMLGLQENCKDHHGIFFMNKERVCVLGGAHLLEFPDFARCRSAPMMVPLCFLLYSSHI